MSEWSPGLRARLEELDERAEFNLFEAAGLVHQEIRHSHFLAYLLSPSENHDLGSRATNALLRHLFDEPHAVAEEEVDRVEVFRETDGIDLQVVNHARQRVYIIENKIWVPNVNYFSPLASTIPPHRVVRLWLTVSPSSLLPI